MRQGGDGPDGYRFDWQGYIQQTTRSYRERIQHRIEAKQTQISHRQNVYEEAVADLQSELGDVEQQLTGMGPTRERRDRLRRRRDQLSRDLVEVRERFAEDIRRLEDTVLELEAELEELCEAEKLLEEIVNR